MQYYAQPKLQAEHMDSLPLTDDRPTRQHLDEISRELNENVMINDVAFRFQSHDTYIGTYIENNGTTYCLCFCLFLYAIVHV